MLASSQAFALTNFKCEVSENVSPPLQERSVKYVLTAQLNSNSQAGIDVDGKILDLKYGFETFRDSEGKQVVLVGANTNGQDSVAYGENSASLFYDVANSGELFAHCFVE